jgi:hypothetical protein
MSRWEEARKLDALAREAPTLAEAQALQARADQLRRVAESRGPRYPLFRN